MIRGNKLEAYIERCTCSKRPITADIFLTNFCNLKCEYCRYNHRDGSFLKFEDFKTYVNRLLSLGVKAIILTGGGEPTINPHFYKMTEWLEQNSIPYGINTNLRKPIYCNPTFVKISIDTGDNREFKKVRGCDALDDVINNTKELVSFKKENGNDTKIGVQCLVTTKSNVLSFYDRVKDLDVDYIYFRPLETKGESNISKETLMEWIKDINDSRINISFKFDLKDYKPSKCFSNWSVITINHKGEVLYCCHKPNEIVGHVMDDDILQKKENYHTDMKLCEHPCRLSGANKYLENLEVEKDIYFI